jgi:uncharacterized membrane protein
MTLLVMLGLLMLPYAVLAPIPGFRGRPALRGCVGIALMFGFTGVGHFLVPGEMARMIPPFVPWRMEIIYVTGVVEIVAGALTLARRTRRQAGWFLLLMLAGLLPFNIWSAVERVPFGGHAQGPVYLWVRVPVQLVIAAWVWWFAARRGRD